MSTANLQPEIKTPAPGPKARAIIERDKITSSPSYIKEYPLVVERGEGAWIYDVDGNRYLDMMAGIAVNSTGHAHPAVVKAIQDAAAKFLHICVTDFYYESATALSERLAGYVPGMGKKKIFLSNSGTEAVEGAIKLARYHTRREKIVAFKGAFHGRTLGAISLNNSKVTQRAFFGPLMSGVIHIPYAYSYRCAYKNPESFCATSCECATALEADIFPNHTDPKEIAAIFVEPILGEGGYVMPPKKFLQDLRRICDEHGILLVFDEIQSGIGRTGKMFACELYDVYPDILLSAKGLGSGMPIGAIIARDKVMSWTRGTHGSTYAGNPVCCAAALATLDVVEKLLPSVQSAGELLKKGLRDLQKKHPVIGDIRGEGFMIGVECVEPGTKVPATALRDKLEQQAFGKGLLLLGCGKSTIRLAPPLVVGAHEIEICLRLMSECLTELGA